MPPSFVPPNPNIPRAFGPKATFRFAPGRFIVQVFNEKGEKIKEVPWSDNPNLPLVLGNMDYIWLYTEQQAGRISIALPDPEEPIPPRP